MTMHDPSLLRDVPLERIARQLGCRPVPGKPRQWRNDHSILSIDGAKYHDHLQGKGGGGAIDLVMHVGNRSIGSAIAFLERWTQRPTLRMPTGHRDAWPSVRRYLLHRGLRSEPIDDCRRQGILRADRRANAVFVRRNVQQSSTGAEIVGQRDGFKSLASGSKRNEGGFWIRCPGTTPSTLLLVEGAIDALSAAQLATQPLFIASTAGVRPSLPHWIRAWKLDTILCGFDADTAGDRCARLLAMTDPRIRRARPQGVKDWNDRIRMRN